MLATVPRPGANTVLITHYPNIIAALGKDWFNVKEGETSHRPHAVLWLRRYVRRNVSWRSMRRMARPRESGPPNKPERSHTPQSAELTAARISSSILRVLNKAVGVERACDTGYSTCVLRQNVSALNPTRE